MSMSREEMETLVNNFDKIATKSDTPAKTNSNSKTMIVAAVLILITIAGGYYLYSKKSKKGQSAVVAVEPASE